MNTIDHRPRSRNANTSSPRRPVRTAANRPTSSRVRQEATLPGNYFISNYPPFSCWSSEEIPELSKALTHSPSPHSAPLGLYVHLPFCRQRCHYCYFRVYPGRNEEDVDHYINAVLAEQDLYLNYPAIRGRPLRTVYFGGGSPSFLTIQQIHSLLDGLRAQNDWSEVEECTFECEPGTVSLAKLETLKEMGVSRLSIGFQTLDDEILRRSGRNVRVNDCVAAFRQAREAGFEEINIDLLAGLPGETDATWRRTVDQVLELSPDCVTIYQLELTYNSALYRSGGPKHRTELADWPTKRRWVGEAFQMCEDAGYTIASGYMAVRDPRRWRFIYTVENFWHGHDLLALGESAFGHMQGVHYQNADTFTSYTGALEEGRLPVQRAIRLNEAERLRRELILQLKTGHLDYAYFEKKFGVDLLQKFATEWDKLQQKDQLRIRRDAIELTRDGLLQVDTFLPLFYLPEHIGIRYT